MKKVRVSLGNRSYDILIGKGLLGSVGAIAAGLKIGDGAIVVTNKKLSRLFYKKISSSLKRAGITSALEMIPDSERAKSFGVLEDLLKRISRRDRGKTPFIIALGGGVAGDLAGFAAAVYKRGIPYIQIPTTLLAQVDSAIGGKVAVDLPAAKNLAGAFYQPRAVISDINALRSLPEKEIKRSLAECIKYGVISDRALFEYIDKNMRALFSLDAGILEHVILRASRIKAGVVSKDEFDRNGKRMILNYGHTVGHAIEAAGEYTKRYSHGEAIAIGMAVAAHISSKLGLLSEEGLFRIEALIKKCSLPLKIKGLKLSSIYGALTRDKKFLRGKKRFVLPLRVGKAVVVGDVPRGVVMSAIKKYME